MGSTRKAGAGAVERLPRKRDTPIRTRFDRGRIRKYAAGAHDGAIFDLPVSNYGLSTADTCNRLFHLLYGMGFHLRLRGRKMDV